MKHAIAICAVLLIIIVGLGQTVIDPGDYTGEWYSSDDQSIYHFQDGLIYCSKHAVALSGANSISGAYSYCRNSVFLFAEGIDGLESEKEIFLIHKDEGSFLCENKDGTGKIYFMRHKD